MGSYCCSGGDKKLRGFLAYHKVDLSRKIMKAYDLKLFLTLAAMIVHAKKFPRNREDCISSVSSC